MSVQLAGNYTKLLQRQVPKLAKVCVKIFGFRILG